MPNTYVTPDGATVPTEIAAALAAFDKAADQLQAALGLSDEQLQVAVEQRVAATRGTQNRQQRIEEVVGAMASFGG